MVSTKATMLCITLLTSCLLVPNTSAGYARCCRSYMKTKIPFRAIKGYTVQTITGMCTIDAIIFLTKQGKVCSNPALDWVNNYVQLLGKKAAAVHKNSKRQK